MKRLAIALLALPSLMPLRAQIAHWVVRPTYDVIQASEGQSLVIADEGNSSMLMNLEGKCLVKSEDVLHAVGDDIAVTTKPSTSIITGYYTISGQFKELKGYNVAHGFAQYSEGNLLVKEGNDFVYIDVDGHVVGAAAQAYPFSNGFSACQKYPSPDKRKGATWCLITGDMQPSKILLNGKDVSNGGIEFISSVNGDGKCVVVLKGQLYLFSDSDLSLTPISADGGNTPAKLTTAIKDRITPSTTGPLTLKAKGKGGDVTVELNEQMILQSIKRGGETQTFPLRSAFGDPTSKLSVYERGGKKGISYDGTEVLAAQFDAVDLCANNHAAVSLNGKSGIIQVDPKEKFEFEFNGGNGLPFRHQKLKTTLRLDTPSSVSMESAQFISAPDGTCQFDATSKRAKDTQFGNAIQYNCTLTIPEGLPDEITDVTFPVQVAYEGLTSAVIQCHAKAWHYKYLTIKVDESKTIFSANGDLTFTFNITAERLKGESPVPYEVDVHCVGHKATPTKVSETHYRCQVFDLKEGKNIINVKVTEAGCPPVSYPFEVDYNKAKAQQAAAARKPAVRIESRVRANPTQPTTPKPEKKNRPVLDI